MSSGDYMSNDEGAQAMKENAIRLARHHRRHCEGAQCDVSLYLLGKLLATAKIGLTDEEAREFM